MTEDSAHQSADDSARLRAVLDAAVDGIITIDERGTIESANPAAEKLFGYSASEMIGHNVRMLMPSPYSEEHDGYLADYSRTGERKIVGIGRVVDGRRKDGTTFPLYLAVSEVSFEHRRIFTGFVLDVTERKRVGDELASLNTELEQRVEQRTKELRETQAQLIRKEKLAALGQLSGGVAHEIRNPLGVIKNSVYYLKIIADQLSADARECVEEIDQEVETANRIVSELLDFTRDPPSHAEVFLLERVVANAILAARVPTEVHQTVAELDPAIQLHADQGQIERVLANLIRNAWQAMSGRGNLSIEPKLQGDHVVIDVRDTGVGIPAENLVNVFEPLYTTKAKGIGLGVAVSRRYAQRNGGSMTVESSVGKGTVFHFSVRLNGVAQ
ncbi:MAG: PAS domain S-box protein [Planctomycetota bacterium]|nr:PAS domain S-box protein [Planctomycetota bacterium]